MTEMAPLTTVPLPVRLRAADYLMLDEAGAFQPYGKTELLDGKIVYMNAQHRPHGRVKMALYEALSASLRQSGSALSVAVEVSIALTDHDTPEPDLTLTSEAEGDGFIPAPSVALIVEVADTTLRSDLDRKAVIYARAGVSEYWVADVSGRVVHQMWAPQGDRFTGHRTITFGDPIVAVTIDRLEIETSRL